MSKDSSPREPAALHRKPFLDNDAEAAFRHFVPLVARWTDLERWNADPDRVHANISWGVDAVRPHRAQIAKALPLSPFDNLLEMVGR